MMRMSERGIAFLKDHEQLRLRAYDDLEPWRVLEPGGVVHGTVTIGWGHTRTAEPGMEISERYAEELLRRDLEPMERGVRRLLDGQIIEQHEFDALVSFAFNVGLGALEQSTLLAKLRAGAPKREVAQEFHRWVYSKGQRLAGLERRRADEANIFLHGSTHG
jgi:lysozyme